MRHDLAGSVYRESRLNRFLSFIFWGAGQGLHERGVGAWGIDISYLSREKVSGTTSPSTNAPRAVIGLFSWAPGLPGLLEKRA